uniref:Uncharacterized protein n=1 Tax=Rhizophagus irregularis (strain DAOM 181602 / DAOM 197198 / MUCL 43194) TaxID=747089 RepID=U9UI57_RHIID
MIVNVPTFYMVYLDQHFAEVSRGMITDEDIYESLKNVEYVEKLSVKRQYKYKTVRAKIRLTKSYETIYKEECLMLNYPKEIRNRYSWQGVKKVDMEKYKVIKEHKENYGGHFAKIIKVNKIKHIQIYYNNEQDLMKAVYDSEMQENIGGRIQINELISKERFVKRPGRPKGNTCASSEDYKFLKRRKIQRTQRS